MLITKSCQCNINGDLAVVYDTPIFHDVKQIMTGYGPLPASEGVCKEVNWGEKNGYRLLLGFGKEFCKETILEKKPNEYWKYQLNDFKNSSFFFVNKVEGEIWVKEMKNSVVYFSNKYTFYNRNIFTLPITFLFVHLIWSGLQKKALKNLKNIIEEKAQS